MKRNYRLFPSAVSAGEGGQSFTTGIFPSQHIRAYIERGYLRAGVPIQEEQIQPASLDLRLGNVAYEIPASVLPGTEETVADKIGQFDEVTHHDLREATTLEVGKIYIIPLQESVRLPAEVSARTNPKSSIGRLDIFVRCLTDYATGYNAVAGGYKGPLYVEVVPHSFPIVIAEGVSLNQIRFRRGNPPSPDSELHSLHERNMLLYSESDTPEAYIERGLHLTVNIAGGGEEAVVGYTAKKDTPPLDLCSDEAHPTEQYWEPLHASDRGIVLEPDAFYLLASKEWVRVPPQYSAEMQAYDPQMGEFRAHYAGFFDPGFGFGRGEVEGSRAVLEVRPHKIPFLLEGGQVVGRLRYERLMEQPDKVYNAEIGSSYQGQSLSLSKHFT